MIVTALDPAAAVQAPPPAPGGSWLRQAARFTQVETATYLRDKTAIFWTFVYPIVMLVLLMTMFGEGRSFVATVDVEGQGAAARRFTTLLERRFAAIEGATFTMRQVAPGEDSPKGRVRVILPARFGTSEQPGPPIRVVLRGAVDAESGAMLSVLAETATQLNANLAGTPQTVRVAYDVPPAAKGPDTAVYYVVGIGVLTMISTALFGFSGPLIELRAGGGLKRFQFMPVHKSAFLVGFAMCRVLILILFVLGFVAGGLAAYAGIDALLKADWAGIAVLVAAGSLAFLAAGLALAGLVTSNTLASAVINFVNLPIMFLSDLFVPLNILPEFVQQIGRFSPVFLLVEAMRGAAAGGAIAWGPLAFSLLAMGGVSMLIVALSFRWKLSR